MASFSNLTDIDLERQIDNLSKELAALRKTAAKHGSAYYEDGRDAVRDYYSDIGANIGAKVRDTLPVIRRQGRAIERSAREHPTTAAIMGVAALGLLAALLLGRRG
jgi:hypothetical protein